MSQPEGQPLYELEMPVRWGDMDALGHVNNIMYFRYFEQVRLQWYETLGFGKLASTDNGMLIVNNHAEYLLPLVYPAQMHIRMSGHSPGRSSFTSTYSITVGDTLFTRGSSKIVWVNTTTGKSVPLPDSVRALITGELHV